MPSKNLKKGGCVSDYANMNDSYMLATTGGAARKRKPAKRTVVKRKIGGSDLALPPAFDNLGASFNQMISSSSAAKGGALRRKGGVDLALPPAFNSGFQSSLNQMVTNASAAKGGALRRKGGVDYASINDNYMLYNASAASAAKGGSCGNNRNTKKGGNVFDNLGSSLNRMVNNVSTNSGGCCGNKNSKKGGNVVALAPMLTSLVLLGARAATDKSFKQSMNKGLGSLLVSKSSLKSKSKS
jgi:hypothetical protein